jgi:hypothetical protein
MVLPQSFVLCNISYGRGSNFMDLFRLRTRNKTFVANHRIIPNPTLSLLGQCLSNHVPRNPGIRCFTSTGLAIEFRWYFSQLAFQTSCSFTHMQLAAYSDVSAAPISERVPGKMLKHGAFLFCLCLSITRGIFLVWKQCIWFLMPYYFPCPVWVCAASFKPKKVFVMK